MTSIIEDYAAIKRRMDEIQNGPKPRRYVYGNFRLDEVLKIGELTTIEVFDPSRAIPPDGPCPECQSDTTGFDLYHDGMCSDCAQKVIEANKG